MVKIKTRELSNAHIRKTDVKLKPKISEISLNVNPVNTGTHIIREMLGSPKRALQRTQTETGYRSNKTSLAYQDKISLKNHHGDFPFL